ncbi:PD-(D/E)XK nuclease family protein [Flagellimonas sp. DF-77]|uniref:PD-(D/E)XK nuclease family protein n=1 Tax=Flagellimonas algarum TaxID=3230298 RepID=UPI0033923EA8
MRTKPFLETIIDRIWNDRSNFSGLVFVVPSIRSGTFLRKYIANYLDAPIIAPEIKSIEAFIAEISGLDPIANTFLPFELYEAYLESDIPEKENLESFLKWGQLLLADFNEIDRHLIDSKTLFSYLASAKRLNEWGVQAESNSLVSNYLRFWDSLSPMYDRFVSALIDKSAGHQGLLYRKAYENCDTYLERQGGSSFVFIGFNALNTSEQRILQKFLEHPNNSIYWDTDRYFLNDPQHDASYFIRKYQREWPFLKNNALQGVSAHYLEPKHMEVIGIPKYVSQAKYAGSLLARLHAQRQHLDKVALVLADEALLPALMNALPEHIGPVNITMGYPVERTAVYRMLSDCLAFQLTKTKKGWRYTDLLQVLGNPLMAQLIEIHQKGLVSALERLVHSGNSVFVDQDQLKRLVAEENDFLQRLFIGPTTLGPRLFIEMAYGMLVDLEAKGILEGPFQMESHRQLRAILKSLEEALADYPGLITLAALKPLLDAHVASARIHFKGDPFKGLQIMGMLETRSLDFETVILCSVNEGILPSGKNMNSFIPYDIKKEFALPTHKEKDAIYTYHFYRLLQRAKNVYLTYNTEADVLEGGEKSRLLSQLLTDTDIPWQITHRKLSPRVPYQNTPLKEIPKTDAMVLALHQFGEKGFSPSSLATYIRNPMQFYRQYLLGIKEIETIEATIAPNTFGTIIHDSLEDLYRPYVGTTITEHTLDTIEASLVQVVSDHFNAFFPNNGARKGKNLIAFEVILTYVSRLVAFDRERVKKDSIHLIAVETGYETGLSLPGIPNPIRLRGKIDRIESINGQTVILDYKTGNVLPSATEIVGFEDACSDPKKDKALQLMCYALLFNAQHTNTPLSAAVVPIKDLQKGLRYFATKSSAHSRTKERLIDQEVISSFSEQLKELILAIFDPNTPIYDLEE